MSNEKFISVLSEILENKSPSLESFSQEEKEVLIKVVGLVEKKEDLKSSHDELHSRLEQLLDVLVEFAQFNFSMEIPISDNADELDGIALGLQTLGQEIEFYQKELVHTNDNLKEAQAMAKIGSWEVLIPSLEMTWSDEMYNIYGLEKDGNEMEKVKSLFSEEVSKTLEDLFSKALSNQEPYRIVTKVMVNGKEKHVDSQAKPIVENGETVKIVGTAMDVTERTLAQLKLQKLNFELEEKVAERTKDLEGFSYSVSHDLRAPLRSISGFSNMLAENYADKLDEEGKHFLDIIVNNANKMATLIQELLNFSRVGISLPEFVPVDLNKLMEETWNQAMDNFEERDRVEVSFADVPNIVGAEQMVEQVFANLFSNALKYSSKQEKITVEVGIKEQNDDKITLFVKDNGCGFDMKYHEKLFGVFQRLHSEDEYKGTGVGLALVKRIIDKHHGKIWAESKLGEGTTFYVILPLHEAAIS